MFPMGLQSGVWASRIAAKGKVHIRVRVSPLARVLEAQKGRRPYRTEDVAHRTTSRR